MFVLKDLPPTTHHDARLIRKTEPGNKRGGCFYTTHELG